MPRGTCWKGYAQKGMKMKNGRSVPNCVPVQKAYLGKAVRQPSETDNEFKIRHEMHTPFMDIKKKKIVKAQTGKEIKKALKQISKTTPFIGYDVSDLVGLDQSKGESAALGAKLDLSKDSPRPALTASMTKGPLEFAVSGTGKDDYGIGSRYFSEDKSTESILSFSKDNDRKEAKFTLKKSFNTGGLIKGKPKLALRGWK
jgi:signal recognition particle subunit SEC65